MEEYAAQFKSPTISSNEGETANKLAIEFNAAHPNMDSWSSFIAGYEAGQSQHSYTEADLKAAWQAGNDFGNECHCGECDYCIDVKYGEAQPFDVWVKRILLKATPKING